MPGERRREARSIPARLGTSFFTWARLITPGREVPSCLMSISPRFMAVPELAKAMPTLFCAISFLALTRELFTYLRILFKTSSGTGASGFLTNMPVRRMAPTLRLSR